MKSKWRNVVPNTTTVLALVSLVDAAPRDPNLVNARKYERDVITIASAETVVVTETYSFGQQQSNLPPLVMTEPGPVLPTELPAETVTVTFTPEISYTESEYPFEGYTTRYTQTCPSVPLWSVVTVGPPPLTGQGPAGPPVPLPLPETGGFPPLPSPIPTEIPEALNPAEEISLLQVLREAPTQAERIHLLKARGGQNAFKFDFNNPPEKSIADGRGGEVISADGNSFPATFDTGLSLALVNLEPCGIFAPHIHPRADENIIVQQGYVRTQFLDGDGTPLVTTSLGERQSTVFPKGSIHFEFNPTCQPTTFVSAFNSDDPGLILVAPSLLSLDDQAVSGALGNPRLDGSQIYSIKDAVPQDAVVSVQQCLISCARLAKRDVVDESDEGDVEPIPTDIEEPGDSPKIVDLEKRQMGIRDRFREEFSSRFEEGENDYDDGDDDRRSRSGFRMFMEDDEDDDDDFDGPNYNSRNSGNMNNNNMGGNPNFGNGQMNDNWNGRNGQNRYDRGNDNGLGNNMNNGFNNNNNMNNNNGFNNNQRYNNRNNDNNNMNNNNMNNRGSAYSDDDDFPRFTRFRQDNRRQGWAYDDDQGYGRRQRLGLDYIANRLAASLEGTDLEPLQPMITVDRDARREGFESARRQFQAQFFDSGDRPSSVGPSEGARFRPSDGDGQRINGGQRFNDSRAKVVMEDYPVKVETDAEAMPEKEARALHYSMVEESSVPDSPNTAPFEASSVEPEVVAPTPLSSDDVSQFSAGRDQEDWDDNRDWTDNDWFDTGDSEYDDNDWTDDNENWSDYYDASSDGGYRQTVRLRPSTAYKHSTQTKRLTNLHYSSTASAHFARPSSPLAVTVIDPEMPEEKVSVMEAVEAEADGPDDFVSENIVPGNQEISWDSDDSPSTNLRVSADEPTVVPRDEPYENPGVPPLEPSDLPLTAPPPVQVVPAPPQIEQPIPDQPLPVPSQSALPLPAESQPAPPQMAQPAPVEPPVSQIAQPVPVQPIDRQPAVPDPSDPQPAVPQPSKPLMEEDEEAKTPDQRSTGRKMWDSMIGRVRNRIGEEEEEEEEPEPRTSWRDYLRYPSRLREAFRGRGRDRETNRQVNRIYNFDDDSLIASLGPTDVGSDKNVEDGVMVSKVRLSSNRAD
jgi:hypothetical protein